MTYVFIFAGLAILLVVAVLVRNARTNGGSGDSPHHAGTAGASRTPSGSAERHERKRRRQQSKNARRKRH